MGTIVLPVNRSSTDQKWISQKIAVLGPAKIGKSRLFSFDDNTLYIQTEAGLNHLSVKKLVAKSWDEYKAIETALLQAHSQGKFPYTTVVIDTVDRLISLVEDDVVELAKNKYKKAVEGGMVIEGIQDVPEGGGWMRRTDLVMATLEKLETLPACIVYIGHVEMKEIKTPTEKYHKRTINIGGKLGLELLSWPDHIINMNASMVGDKIRRVATIMPTKCIEAGSRSEKLLKMSPWQMDDDDKKNWDVLRGCFE